MRKFCGRLVLRLLSCHPFHLTRPQPLIILRPVEVMENGIILNLNEQQVVGVALEQRARRGILRQSQQFGEVAAINDDWVSTTALIDGGDKAMGTGGIGLE